MRRDFIDPLDDRWRECAHGAIRDCPECEAEAEAYLAAERRDGIELRAAWFCYGAGAALVSTLLGMILWLPK